MTHLHKPAVDSTERADLADVLRAIELLRGEVREVGDRLAGRMKDHYTVEEVAAMTGRAPYTVRGWIRGALMCAERVMGTGPRGRLLIARAELERLISSGRGRDLSAIAAGRDMR